MPRYKKSVCTPTYTLYIFHENVCISPLSDLEADPSHIQNTMNVPSYTANNNKLDFQANTSALSRLHRFHFQFQSDNESAWADRDLKK